MIEKNTGIAVALLSMLSILSSQVGACNSSTNWVSETQSLSSLSQLKKDLPLLYSKMEADSLRASWLSLWGRCIDFDELAKGVIVEPPIINMLLDLMRAPTGPALLIDGRLIVHAGVQHTYGYLFSNLKTAFGYKRERWTKDTIDRGFGFPEGTITPTPEDGTLFSSVTYLAGKIAFRNDPELLRVLAAGQNGVNSAVLNFDYDSLHPTRLEEVIATPQGDVTLRTDFVPFLKKSGSGPGGDDMNTHLLIYSIVDARKGLHSGTQLITVFPVGDSTVSAALAPNTLGSNQPIQTRYNAYVEGISGQTWTGIRRKP